MANNLGDPQIQEALRKFFDGYDAESKVSDEYINSLSEKYAGKENELWRKLYDAYDPESKVSDDYISQITQAYKNPFSSEQPEQGGEPVAQGEDQSWLPSFVPESMKRAMSQGQNLPQTQEQPIPPQAGEPTGQQPGPFAGQYVFQQQQPSSQDIVSKMMQESGVGQPQQQQVQQQVQKPTGEFTKEELGFTTPFPEPKQSQKGVEYPSPVERAAQQYKYSGIEGITKGAKDIWENARKKGMYFAASPEEVQKNLRYNPANQEVIIVTPEFENNNLELKSNELYGKSFNQLSEKQQNIARAEYYNSLQKYMTADEISEAGIDPFKGRFANALSGVPIGATSVLTGTAKGLAITSQPISFEDFKYEFEKQNPGMKANENDFIISERARSSTDPANIAFLGENRDYYNKVRMAADAAKAKGAMGSFIYKGAEDLQKYVEKTFPTNPKYAQEFWSSKLPQGLGSMFAFMGAGMATGGVGIPSYIVPGILGALSNGASQFEDALRSTGGDYNKAMQAFQKTYQVDL